MDLERLSVEKLEIEIRRFQKLRENTEDRDEKNDLDESIIKLVRKYEEFTGTLYKADKSTGNQYHAVPK